MKIQMNKTYNFKVVGVGFGDIPSKRILEMFRDGRQASPFLEEHLTHWFPELTRVEGNKDHDHVDRDGRKYDSKNFTKYGLKFMPSNQLGARRKFNAEKAHAKAAKLRYTCFDIVDFPNVRVRFIEGNDLIKDYPKCTVSRSKREALFG